MNQVTPRPRRQNAVLILVLGFLNALTPFTIDMYLPAFPAIARDMNVTVARVALTVSIYFVGFAFGQILYGPLLDRFGRKRPLYVGLSVYILATIGCMLSRSIEALIFFRFLSALGGCAASVGAMAMVRDLFPPAESVKVYSLLMLVLSASPLLAPTAGSLVILVAGWTTVFAILAGMAVLNALFVRFVLPPTREPDHSVALHWRPVLANFWSILRNRDFATYTFAGACSFTGLFVYVAGSPSIFMDGFHVNAQIYGAIFAFLAAGMIGGGQLNLLLLKRYASPAIFRAALVLQVLSATVFLAGAYLDLLGLPGTVACLFLTLFFAGITSPNGTSLALAPFTKNVGSASALLGFMQLGIGAVASAAVGFVKSDGSLPTAATMCLSSVVGLAILLFSTRSKAA